MNSIRLIIAGSRDFNDYELLEKEVDSFILRVQEKLGYGIPVEIVSGGAKGADRLGERYAKDRGLPVKIFFANWDLGRGAGYIRNEEMAKYASDCVVFILDSSKGSTHMANLAKKYNLGLKVINLWVLVEMI